MTSLTGASRKRGSAMFWSSMFRTDTPMRSGQKCSTENLTLEFGSASNIRFSRTTSWPALRVAAATPAAPKGSVGMLIASVLAEMSRTLMTRRFECEKKLESLSS
jgi:hypothetical protein